MITVSYDRDYYSQYVLREEWLENTIGPGGYGTNIRDKEIWSGIEAFGYWTYRFKHDKDATLFMLKWPGASNVIKE